MLDQLVEAEQLRAQGRFIGEGPPLHILGHSAEQSLQADPFPGCRVHIEKATLVTRPGRSFPKQPRSTRRNSPRWMCARGMVVISVPDLGDELIQRFARHVPAIALSPVDPGHVLVTFRRRERQRAVFQFSHTHREFTLPLPGPRLKPE